MFTDHYDYRDVQYNEIASSRFPTCMDIEVRAPLQGRLLYINHTSPPGADGVNSGRVAELTFEPAVFLFIA